jgi:hypothetical protein
MRSLPCRARKLNVMVVLFEQWKSFSVWCHTDRIQVLLKSTMRVNLSRIYTLHYDYIYFHDSNETSKPRFSQNSQHTTELNKYPRHANLYTSRILRLSSSEPPSQGTITIPSIVSLTSIPPIIRLNRSRRIGRIRSPIDIPLHIQPILIIKRQNLRLLLSRPKNRNSGVSRRVVIEVDTGRDGDGGGFQGPCQDSGSAEGRVWCVGVRGCVEVELDGGQGCGVRDTAALREAERLEGRTGVARRERGAVYCGVLG